MEPSHHQECPVFNWGSPCVGERPACACGLDDLQRIVTDVERLGLAHDGTARAEGHRRIIRTLIEIMNLAPSLRVCQIIGNSIPVQELQRRGNDIYYIEDDELFGHLRVFEDFLIHHPQPEEGETSG